MLEREPEAGGIPRHAHHQGFGLRDLRRVHGRPGATPAATPSWPRAPAARVVTGAMVTGWTARARWRSPARAGARRWPRAAVLLATGCRERPRSARLVPGIAAGRRDDDRACSSSSSTCTAARAGRRARRRRRRARELLRVADPRPRRRSRRRHGHRASPRTRRSRAFRARRGRCATGCRSGPAPRSRRSAGAPRVEVVELTDLDTGAVRTVACDTSSSPPTGSPTTSSPSSAGSSSTPARAARRRRGAAHRRPGVFAAGNVIHGAETADVAALDGRHVAAAVAADCGRRLLRPAGAPGARRGAAALGLTQPRRRRRGTATAGRRSCCARRVSARPGSRSGRARIASYGTAGSPARARGAPPTSRPTGYRRKSTPSAGPVMVQVPMSDGLLVSESTKGTTGVKAALFDQQPAAGRTRPVATRPTEHPEEGLGRAGWRGCAGGRYGAPSPSCSTGRRPAR